MGLEYIGESNPFEQRETDPSEQPRFFECFQCPSHLVNIAKMDNDTKRHICIVMDYENLKIYYENQKMMNPALRVPLKRCPYHMEVDPEVELPTLPLTNVS